MDRSHHWCEGSGRRNGAALVTVLILLAILSVMVVGLISMTSLDRDATQNYAMGAQAEQIGLGGVDQILTQLLSEAVDPARNTIRGTAPNALALPTDANYIIPARMPGQASRAVIKYSLARTPLYSPATANANTNLASASSSTNASFNGRRISLERWNKPQLLETTAGFTPPDWIYMGRLGPLPLSTSVNPTTQSLSSTSLRNTSAVVGRYAYVVYDVGGLLDINVAGYPSTEPSSGAVKGTAAWADLTQLAASITVTDVDKLVAWRNAAQSGNYASYVTNSATNGFLRVFPGDNAFLGRQDLIKFATTENPVWKTTLPYLTTFSRAANAPSWGPAADASNGYNYRSQQFAANNINPFLLQARVKNTSWTRWDGSRPVAGEPLLKTRFPLNKLALLEKMQGVGTLSTGELDDVARYFGLDLVNDSNGYYRHWTYPTTNPKYLHTPGQILTLDQVADLAQGREPDFFELLQAAVLDGSLGTVGRGDSPLPPANNTGQYSSSFKDPDSKKTMQTLRIGANIIDQYSRDNYPTTITLGLTGDNVYGVQDLPYLNKIYLAAYAAIAGKPPFEFHLYFELWNPHQATSTSGASPTQFRLVPFSKASVTSSDQVSDWYQTMLVETSSGNKYWSWNGELNAWDTTWGPVQHLSSLPSGGVVPFLVTDRATQYRGASLIRTGSPLPVGGWAPGSSLSVVSLNPIPNFPTSATPDLNGNTTTWPSASWSLKLNYSFVYRLQFQDSKGAWQTYGTFVGSDNPNVPLPGTGVRGGPWLSTGTSSPPLGKFAIAKSDPRTTRFGAGFAISSATANAPSGPIDNVAPFIGQVTALQTTPYRMDYFAVNDPAVAATGYTTGGAPYYASLDGVRRPGDARYVTFPANGPQNNTTARPIVLNRPFQSVGELGYAFRDEPWKTLDLFSPNSADSALLDLFSLSGPTPLSAGGVSPNTPYYQVAAALLAGTEQNATGTASISSAAAKSIAQALVTLSTQKPFANRVELVNRLMSAASVSSLSANKSNREAVIRALAENAETRTWNLLIDVIAQSGTYPVNATKLDDFFVRGERRYWLHVAIDRYTGKILDRQLEVVTE